MSDDIELEFEGDYTRAEIADILETFAEGLRDDGGIDLPVGDRTAVVDPPETVEFEIEVEDEADDDEDEDEVEVERSVEFELEWTRGDDEEPLPEPDDLEESEADEESEDGDEPEDGDEAESEETGESESE